MKFALTALLGAASFALPNAASAAVVLTDYFGIGSNAVSDFEDVIGSAGLGINYDGILISGGVSYAEHFAGQVLTSSGDFDVLTNTDFPFGLFLQTGAPDQNLDVFKDINGTSNVLGGIGPQGYTVAGIGEGAIAALFANGQSAFGFQVIGGNGGEAHVSFFDDNGVAIDQITLSGLASQYYGFRFEGLGAPIRGFTIWNEDPFGLGIDNVIFTQAAIPEPATWALLILGFGVIGSTMRSPERRRRLVAAP